MQPIQVETPDGTIVEFPEGTDRATIQRVMRERFSSTQNRDEDLARRNGELYAAMSQKVIEELTPPALTGFVGALPRSFNFYDELTGAAASATSLATGIPISGQAAAERQSQQVQQYREDNPARAMAEEVAVQLPLALTGIGAGARGAALTGAAFGGLTGVGSGETTQERVVGGAVGAGLGAGVGVGSHYAGNEIGRRAPQLARAMQRRISGSGGNMTRAQRRAFAEARSALQRDGLSRSEAEQALERLAQNGFDDVTLADIAPPGGNFQRLIRAAGSRGGNAGRALEDQLQSRLESQADRVSQRLSQLLSGSEDFTAQSQELLQRRAERAGPLYRAAFYRSIDRAPGLNEITALSREADFYAPSVDDALAAARQLRRGGPQRQETLSQFVRRMGGLADDRGDIAAAAGSRQRAASLLRSSGRQIDDLAQAATESGYFPTGRPDRAEFLDALSNDLSGRPVVPADDVSSLDRASLNQTREWFERNNVDWTNQNETELRRQIASAFAPQGQPSRSAADLTAEAQARAQMGADQIEQLVLVNRDQFNQVLGRVPRRAVAIAQRLARLEGRGLGSLDGDQIAVRDLHFVKMGLDDMIAGSRRGQNSIANTERRALIQAREDLLRSMPSQYREAMDAFAGESALIDALNQGRRALRGDSEGVEQALLAMTDGERQMFRAGLVRAAREQVERAPDGADVVRRIIGTEDKRRRIAAAFDDMGQYRQFEQALRNEQARVQNARFVAPSSGPQAAMRGIDAGQEGAGLLGDLLNLDFGRAALRAGRVGGQARRQAMRRATDDELIVLATRVRQQASPSTQAAMLDSIAQEYGEEAAQRVRNAVVAGAIPSATVATNQP